MVPRLGCYIALIVGVVLALNVTADDESHKDVQVGPIDSRLSEIARGKEVYRRYGCQLCHGQEGEKGIRNINTQTADEIPALSYVAEGFTVEQLKKKIREGVWDIAREDSKGPIPPYRMPGWGDRMSEQNLNALAKYLFSLMPEEENEQW